jgi:hypothetical protein
MVDNLEHVFSGLRSGQYQVTSPTSKRYDCIAWAAGDAANWWWPVSDSRVYWPPGVIREETLAAFEAAFGALGYVVCDGDELESGFEKVAVFADADQFPTHAARQLADGRWTSKLGEREDIDHRLRDLEGDLYGRVVRFLKRPCRTDAGPAVAKDTGSENEV